MNQTTEKTAGMRHDIIKFQQAKTSKERKEALEK
jgi:hypothetical protein